MDLPVACTLTDAEMRERRATILNAIRRAVLDITPLPGGYAYRFVKADREPICLEITGPPEAKPVIAEFFGS
jgi:hypothetical protein